MPHAVRVVVSGHYGDPRLARAVALEIAKREAEKRKPKPKGAETR